MPTTHSDHHPGLTFRVYRVNPATGHRTLVRDLKAVPADPAPMLTMSWPPCTCPRHRGGGR